MEKEPLQFDTMFDDLSGDFAESIVDELSDIESDDNLDDYGEGEEITPEQLAQLLEEREQHRCEPRPYKLTPTKKIIAVVDCETDPFLEERVPMPFAVGFLTDTKYVDFWGDDCVQQFFDYLEAETSDGTEYIIYAHNGGKFDFYYFLDYLNEQKSPLIIGGRLVKLSFKGQEFRDSYAIIPEPLSAYKKDEIDYDKFERNVREKNKREILQYLQKDCEYTRDLILGFHELFGDKLTIASAGLPMLRNYHGFEQVGSEQFDARFRQFYFGGRNQCFETGILRPRTADTWSLYDRNGMYASEMRDTLHPISNRPTLTKTITDNTDFACVDAINDGALPTRAFNGGLDFTKKRGTFQATIHEINAGIETETLTILKVNYAWGFDMKSTFSDFVNEMYAKRDEAKANGDRIRDLLYKRCVNAPYGKFALNPRKFREWLFTNGTIPIPQQADDENGWSLHSQSGDIFIWSRPSPRKGGFINVATAASITGAARANLLRNLAKAERPIYCDTDSIICEAYNGPTDEKELGAWKLEATGDTCAIAGKKLYCLYNQRDLNERNEAVKKASKGVRLTPWEIISVCKGQEIIYRNPVPTFSLDGEPTFINRTIKMTGD